MDNRSRQKGLFILLFMFLLLLFRPISGLAMEELKVGYVPGTGFLEEDQPGHMKGNGYEYMEFLSGFLGSKFIYVPCVSWWEAGAKLNSGEIDLLPAMPGDYKSLPFAQRTDHVIARFPMELVVQEEFVSGQGQQLRLGTLDYNYPVPSLPSVAREQGFTYELITFSDPTMMKQAFTNRSLDGYIQPLLNPGKSERVLALFDRVSYRLLVKQGRPELFSRVNAAQDSLLLNQPNIRNQLNDKYERAKGFPLVLTPAEKSYLQEKQLLRVAVLIKNRPYFYKDEAGNWTGSTKALLEQLEKDLGVEIAITETDSPEEIARLVKRGTIDLVADVPCDFSWLENLGLIPTQSYIDMGFVPVSRHGAAMPAKPKVAAVEKMFETDNFIRSHYPEEQILYCRSWEECFQAVSNGLADITYVPRATVSPLMEAVSAYNLTANTEVVFMDSISLGVAATADMRLWQILDKEINHLPPGLLTEALSKSSHEHAQQLSLQYLLYHYPLQAAALIFLIMGTVLGIICYRSRNHRQQLAAMEELACTDRRYPLPNLLYLERKLPAILQRLKQEQPDAALYAVILAGKASEAALRPNRQEQAAALTEAARLLKDRSWIQEAVAGTETGELLCLCTAVSQQAMSNLTAELVTDLRGQVPALTWHGGFAPLTEDKLNQAEEQASLACAFAAQQNTLAKIWDKNLIS